ncbi:MAG: tRNA-(ms[2]io[6]A)-hydroxylase [Myxococcota bacterium]|nr:tRNA-(ms[2]io[6]A)-hydroxylase [Myxococcota bacterium]
MLRLASTSRPDWLTEALADIDLILLDHAHCEKKAASTALGLIFRYADQEPLAAPLSALAREELQHFEQVLAILRKRNIPFRRLEPSTYAARLHEAVRRKEPHRIVDVLICCALIEARSCERMQLLAESLEDQTLRRLYRSLLASEARHHQTYLDLAHIVATEDVVVSRLDALSAHEARVLASGEQPTRLHS